jgi:hypothetical protein
MTKIYPDHTLENELRERGIWAKCLWEMRGPKDTDIAWMVAYAIAGSVVIVQTYKSGGWQVYLPSQSIRTDETVGEVIERCDLTSSALLAPDLYRKKEDA